MSQLVVLHHANVITLNRQHPRTELVAAKGDRIVYVGRNGDIEHFDSQRTTFIDCQGKTLVPGFNDAHCHLMSYVGSLLSIDCSKAASISDIKAAIGDRARQTPPGTWITGTGYNEFYLSEKRHPNRWDLDEAAPDHPIRLVHRSWHATVLNSLALKQLSLSVETAEPPGALFDRVPDTGELNGLLFGMESYLKEKLPPLTEDQLQKGVALANQELLLLGITSIQDASHTNGLAQWQTFGRFKADRWLDSRVSMMIGFDHLAEFREGGMTPGYGDEHLHLGAVKIVLDRATGSIHPPQDVLDHQVLEAHRAGFQVALHAVEESTLEAAIIALEKALKELPRDDHRHRIEHCSICPPGLLQRLKSLRAVVVTQPSFLYHSGERYLKEVPPQELRWLYCTGAFYRGGLTTAASSDFPVVPPGPLTGIYAAVTRKAETGQTILPGERVTALQALVMYTRNGAFAAFDDKVKGTISVGNLADLVLLNADPTRVPGEELREIKVLMTVVGGKVLWRQGL